nr:MAG TPA: hypothetical protein [Bacteriophage sp.]
MSGVMRMFPVSLKRSTSFANSRCHLCISAENDRYQSQCWHSFMVRLLEVRPQKRGR